MESRSTSPGGSTAPDSVVIGDSDKGSSVSSIEEESEELLRYATVTPQIRTQLRPYSSRHHHGDDKGIPFLTSDTTATNVMAPPMQRHGPGRHSEFSASSEYEDDGERSTLEASWNAPTDIPSSDISRDEMPMKTPVPITDKQSSRLYNVERHEEVTRRTINTDVQMNTQKRRYPPYKNHSFGGLDDDIDQDTQPRIDDGQDLQVVDEDIVRLDCEIDNWTAMLKKAVLSEFGHTKVQMLQRSRLELEEQRRKYVEHISRLQHEIDDLKEMVQGHEMNLRKKDQIVANFSASKKKEKEKAEMQKTLHAWQLHHNDTRREAFADKMAARFRQHVVLARAWRAWRESIQNKWKQRVERACQAKAQEVCKAMAADYESKISQLKEELFIARNEVSSMHAKRAKYEEEMKKAFMRGVCALNLEAMSMFKVEEGEEGAINAENGGSEKGDDNRVIEDDESRSHQQPQRFSGAQAGTHKRGGTTSQANNAEGTSSVSSTTHTTSASILKHKYRGGAPGGSSSSGSNPSSVVVQRHGATKSAIHPRSVKIVQ